MNRRELRTRWLFAGLGLFSYGALLTLIVITEGETLTLSDFLIDAVTILLTVGAAVGVGLVAQRAQSQHEEKLTLIRDLESARSDGNGWRKMVQQHFASLRAGVDQQFEIWGMTDAEREIGLLILKGMSHKEIAAARETTDATVRQQAQSIYRKARVPGKTAFSAYFIDDIFAPEEPRPLQTVSRANGGAVRHP